MLKNIPTDENGDGEFSGPEEELLRMTNTGVAIERHRREYQRRKDLSKILEHRMQFARDSAEHPKTQDLNACYYRSRL